MTTSRDIPITLPSGKCLNFWVMSNGEGHICIEAYGIEDVDPTQLGVALKSCAHEAKAIVIEDRLDWVLSYLRDNPKFWREEFAEAVVIAKNFQSPTNMILTLLREIETLYIPPVPKKPRTPRCGFIYIVKGPQDTYKIGRTSDIKNRIKTFSVKLPFDIELEHVIKSDDYVNAETILQNRYQHRRINGEWYALTPDDLAKIKMIESI